MPNFILLPLGFSGNASRHHRAKFGRAEVAAESSNKIGKLRIKDVE
jgi:hypothetical protein